MAIILPSGLPAASVLRGEGLNIRSAVRSGEPAPLRVLLVNLMPDKPRAETQFARVLSATAHSVDLTLTVPAHHVWRHTDCAHLQRFYLPWCLARLRKFDALIITGAPVEMLDFEDVDYWPDIAEMLDWAARDRVPSLFVCWAAQAALYHRFGVPKHALPGKRFGVYRQRVHAASGLLRGLGRVFVTPVSRHTETRIGDLPAGRGLRAVASSPDSGLCLVEDGRYRSAYLFNHPEYDAMALADEYRRDRALELPVALPENYFPGDDPMRPPVGYWQESARTFYANWLDRVAFERSSASRTPARGRRVAALSGIAAVFRHMQRSAYN